MRSSKSGVWSLGLGVKAIVHSAAVVCIWTLNPELNFNDGVEGAETATGKLMVKRP